MLATDRRPLRSVPLRRGRLLFRAARPRFGEVVFEHLEPRLSCSATPVQAAALLYPVGSPVTTQPILLPPIIGQPISYPIKITPSADGLVVTSSLPTILDHRQTYAGPLATFTDTHTGGSPSDYSATIDWGDGSPVESAAITRDPATGVFTVIGSHSYIFGTYCPQVTVTDLRPAGTDADPARVSSAFQTLSVFPPPVAGTAYPVNATSGRTYRATVATYIGLDTTLLSRYAANVSWGDGQYSAGQLVLNPDGSVSVVAEHAYAAPGFYDVSVSLSEAAAANSTDGASIARSRATVADGAFAGIATSVSPISGVPFQGNLVFFKYLSDSHPDPSSLRATVTLGDTNGGTALTGQIIPADGGFYVAIDHLFLNQAYVPFDVRVYDDALPTWQSADHLTGIARGAVTVAPHLHVSPVSPFTATAGVPGRFLVGHVVSDDPLHLWNTTLAATISWGDNSDPSPGELVPTPDGGFDVYGTHAYAITGRSYDLYPFLSVTETRTPAAPGLPPGTQITSASSPASYYFQSHINAGSFTGFYLFNNPYHLDTSTAQIAAMAFTGTDVSIGDFTAFATWNDGTVTPATITDAGDHLDIFASRDLPPGQYTATLTVRAGAYEHSIDLIAYVYQPYDASQYILNATVNTAPTNLFKGQHFHGVVATFTLNDSDPAARPEDFAAYLSSPNASLANLVTSVVRNDDGSFSVIADFDAVTTTDSSYSYYPPSITIQRGSRSARAYWTFSVSADPTLPDLQPKTALSFRQRQQFTTTVATFTPPPAFNGPDVSPDRFSAVIDWGNGVTTAGVITKNWDGSFDISGTYTYHDRFGYVPLRISLTDSLTGRTVFSQSSLYLDHDPVEVTPGAPTVSTDGDGVVSGTLASFTDEDGPSTDPNRYRVYYAALIDWGDGHITDGLVSLQPDGSYKVLSSHTYDTTGDFDVSILVRRNTRYAPVPYLYTGCVLSDTRAFAPDGALADQPNDFTVRLRVSVRRDNTIATPSGPAIGPAIGPDPATPTDASSDVPPPTTPSVTHTPRRARTSPHLPTNLPAQRPTPFSSHPLADTIAGFILDDSKDSSVLAPTDTSPASLL